MWYLLGFNMYAVVLAALGALVSRQEDVATVILPSDPGNALVAVLSMIPLFSPTLMPMRLAMGGVAAWQAILAVVLILALIPVLVMLAARIYRKAVLRTGAGVKLGQALRGS